MERSIEIHNIKKHADKFIDFSEGQMFAFIGKNKSGKSTILQCLESIAMVENTMTDPITQGEESGKVVRKGIDRNGNPITIEWEVSAVQSTFRAAYLGKDGQSKVISDPRIIRELIGTYYPLTVSDVFEWLKFAEGRQKFIKEYIYACLTTDDRVKIFELDTKISDKKNKTTEGNLFQRRAAINKQIEEKNVILRNILVTPAEEEQITLIPAYEERMVEVKKMLEDRNIQEAGRDGLVFMTRDIEDCATKIHSLTEKVLFTQEQKAVTKMMFKVFEELQTKIDELVESTDKALESPKSEILARIEAGEKKITDAKAYQQRKEQRDLALQVLERLNTEVAIIQKAMDEAKATRMDIIANSPLPAGLSFDEETITLNGFIFDGSSVSDTEARLAIMELLCSISTSDFVNIGDWSLYDKDSRAKILEVAKKSNRLIFGQMVTDDENVQCKTIILE